MPSGAIKSIVPIAFFDLRTTPLKAQDSIVIKFSLLGYSLVAITFAALIYSEYSQKVFSQETNFSSVLLDGWDCNAVGVWSNTGQSLYRYVPFQATNGMEVMIDASLTSRHAWGRLSRRTCSW